MFYQHDVRWIEKGKPGEGNLTIYNNDIQGGPDSMNYSAVFELKLPVMFDPDQKVSKGLYLYQTEWGGTKVEQNVPTVFIIDKQGKVKFKYFSQYIAHIIPCTIIFYVNHFI